MNRVEKALETFKKELKKAILEESIEIKYVRRKPGDWYFAEVHVNVAGIDCQFTVANQGCCHIQPFTEGIFKEKEDLEALKALVNRHIQPFTEKEEKELKWLKSEITRIENTEVVVSPKE